MKKIKLKLNRQTVRVLTETTLGEVNGGYQNKKTVSCNCVPNSVLNSCYNTDCCLMVP